MDITGTRSALNRRGQALAEYTVTITIVCLGIAVLVGVLGRATKQAWEHSAAAFSDRTSAGPGGGGPATSSWGSTGGGSSSSGGGGYSGSTPPSPPDAPPERPPADSLSNPESPGPVAAR